MEIEFLGTGAGSPGKFRNVTATALKLLPEINEVWLFDCGEATQHQILRTTIRPRKITKVFITHLHGDHIFGLPGFLSSRSFQNGEEPSPLTIYGPVGVEDFVRTSLRVSRSKLAYKLNFVELDAEGTIFEDERFRVSFRYLEHRIPCMGYRIEEKDYQGELQVDKLKELQIPAGPVYGKLKAGKTVTLADGREINGNDFIGPAKKGRIVTVLGDTRSTPNVAKLAENADVLVHESTYGKGEAKLAHSYYHSTCVQAAQVAKKANVQHLLLTHISARYVGQMVKTLQRDAQEVFKRTKVVKDFDVIKIPFQENRGGAK